MVLDASMLDNADVAEPSRKAMKRTPKKQTNDSKSAWAGEAGSTPSPNPVVIITAQ